MLLEPDGFSGNDVVRRVPSDGGGDVEVHRSLVRVRHAGHPRSGPRSEVRGLPRRRLRRARRLLRSRAQAAPRERRLRDLPRAGRRPSGGPAESGCRESDRRLSARLRALSRRRSTRSASITRRFLPKISHAAIAALGDAEREKLVAGRGRPRDLLPTSSGIVGSSACKTCHEREYAVWSRSAHARSVESLRKERKEDEAECLRCHVTGYGRPGGFPDGGGCAPTRTWHASGASRVTAPARSTSRTTANILGEHRQARRQVRLLRDPADLRSVPRRRQRPRVPLQRNPQDRRSAPRAGARRGRLGRADPRMNDRAYGR